MKDILTCIGNAFTYNKKLLLARHSEAPPPFRGHKWFHLAREPYGRFYCSVFVPKGVLYQDDVSQISMRCLALKKMVFSFKKMGVNFNLNCCSFSLELPCCTALHYVR